MSRENSERRCDARSVPSGSPRQRHHAAARRDLDAEGVFEKPQVFVVDTEERAEPGLGNVQGYRSVLNSAVSSSKA